MIFWRISAFADLSGRGGLLASGRWHSLGRPVVYLAGTPSGAMLEVLVHLEVDQEDFPRALQLLRVHIPERIAMAPAPQLPEGWQLDTATTKAVGDAFLRSGSALLLPIPSAVMPHTQNYLFNPMHADSASAEVSTEVFDLDSRLLRR